MKPWAWRLWLAGMLAALALLAIVQIVRAMPSGPESGQVCEIGLVTRHDAFYSSVLRVFPDRAIPGVHGYIGVADCGMMGRRVELYLGGYVFDVAVADCLNLQHKASHDALWGNTWLADVDVKLWLEARTPARPTQAVLCYAP